MICSLTWITYPIRNKHLFSSADLVRKSGNNRHVYFDRATETGKMWLFKIAEGPPISKVERCNDDGKDSCPEKESREAKQTRTPCWRTKTVSSCKCGLDRNSREWGTNTHRCTGNRFEDCVCCKNAVFHFFWGVWCSFSWDYTVGGFQMLFFLRPGDL